MTGETSVVVERTLNKVIEDGNGVDLNKNRIVGLTLRKQVIEG